MRQQPTDTEHRLWQLVRAKRLSGWKFRRQQPVGRFIADFLCPAAKLIVEVDGGQHGDGVDEIRDQWLRAEGFSILRFWNNDIFNNEEGVLTSILSALEASAAASSRDGRTPLPNRVPGDRWADRAPGTICGMPGAFRTHQSALALPTRGEGLNGGELG